MELTKCSRQPIVVIVDRKHKLANFINECISGDFSNLHADVHLVLHKRIRPGYVTKQFQRIDKAVAAQMAAGPPTTPAPHVHIYSDCSSAEIKKIVSRIRAVSKDAVNTMGLS